jgi:hypothetical protein
MSASWGIAWSTASPVNTRMSDYSRDRERQMKIQIAACGIRDRGALDVGR